MLAAQTSSSIGAETGIKTIAAVRSQCQLMEWSGRASAPPVTNLARGSKDKGARHVPEPQQRSCRDRH
jgi:hypothetical protein